MNSLAALLILFQGTWAGTGEGRLGPLEPWEPAACEITLEWRGELVSRGVCEGGRGRFSAGGEVMVDGDNVAGTFMVPHFVDVAATDVEIAGNALVSLYEIDGMQFRLTTTLVETGVLSMRTELSGADGWVDVAHLTLQPAT